MKASWLIGVYVPPPEMSLIPSRWNTTQPSLASAHMFVICSAVWALVLALPHIMASIVEKLMGFFELTPPLHILPAI